MVSCALAMMAGGGGQGGGGAQGGGLTQMLFLFVAFIAIFYFLILRPQQKRQKEHQKMLESLSKGDKVLTSGGLYGVVVGIKGEVAVLRIADDVKVEVSRSSIQSVSKE
jgi:preprotein translocase subunit YajC